MYIDNQSIGKDVWFDNLVVDHYESEVLEEDHYYPHGLTLNTTPNTATMTGQPYKYNTKELESNFDLNVYDFGARNFDMTIGRWNSIDPFAEKYHIYSPYNFCLNNPILFNDPDGRDAKRTGSGTEEDPYVITAAYYYQNGSLNDDEVSDLQGAVDDYNNLGTQETKDKDGKKVFVKYNLSQQGVDDVDDAIAKTEFEAESADGAGESRVYGNKVSAHSEKVEDYGDADQFSISADRNKLGTIRSDNDRSRMRRGTFVHEIAHNIGAEHGDGTPVMEQRGSSERVGDIGDGFQNSKGIVYPRISPKITRHLLKKLGHQEYREQVEFLSKNNNTMKHIFFLLFSLAVISAYECHSQDTVSIKGYYIVRYNKSEIESKEKNLTLKKEGRKFFEPIDYERVYYFIPTYDSFTSIEKSISSYISDYKAINYYLPQDSYKRKFVFTALGKMLIEKETSYFKNQIYYSDDNNKHLYCIYYTEARAIKYHLQNTKENRHKFGLRIDEVSKGDSFDVVLLYHYTLVTNDFVHLDGFEKWKYKP